ncbi:unnamed protein product [Rhizophagus irregularis]|nr:unnamed protein product [Rhizophagus irregularis]
MKGKNEKVQEDFQRTKTQRFTLPCSEEWKKPRFVRLDGLPYSEEWENSKDSIRWASDLWEKRNQDSFNCLGSVSRVGFRKTEESRFVRVGFRGSEKGELRFSWLLKIEETKIRKFWWASEERKRTKICKYYES